MYFQKDYILRQIELLGQGLAKMFKIDLKSDTLDELINEDGSLSGEQYLGFTLTTLVRDGKIGEAEDLLYETVERHPHKEYLPVAVDFYRMLATLSDNELEEGNFTQQEIVDGMEGIRELFESKEIR